MAFFGLLGGEAAASDAAIEAAALRSDRFRQEREGDDDVSDEQCHGVTSIRSRHARRS